MWRPDESNGAALARAVVGIGAALLAMAVLYSSPAARAESDESAVLVRVNGTPITRDGVREIVKNVIASNPSVPTGQEIDQLTREALDSLIDLELLYQEAEARKIALRDEEIEVEISKTREQFSSKGEFAAALQHSGMTEGKLRQETRKALLANRLLETVVWKGIAISDEAVDEFHRNNRAEFGDANEVHIRQILVRIPPGAPATEREQALLKANRLRAEIEAGAKFEQVARQYSDDAATAPKGDDLGFVIGNDETGPLIEAAAGLEIGACSGVVESADGYYLVQLVARRPGQIQMPPEMRRRIIKLLEEKERRQRQAAFVGELRQRATIKFLSVPQEKAAPHR